jgi:hypothetical protein
MVCYELAHDVSLNSTTNQPSNPLQTTLHVKSDLPGVGARGRYSGSGCFGFRPPYASVYGGEGSEDDEMVWAGDMLEARLTGRKA